MNQPPFDTLPMASGQPGSRIVNGMAMDREEYVTCQWHVTGTYEVQHPHRPGCLRSTVKATSWAATLEGLQRWSQIRRERREAKREAWRTRQEADDQWSSHVQSLIEAKEAS